MPCRQQQCRPGCCTAVLRQRQLGDHAAVNKRSQPRISSYTSPSCPSNERVSCRCWAGWRVCITTSTLPARAQLEYLCQRETAAFSRKLGYNRGAELAGCFAASNSACFTAFTGITAPATETDYKQSLTDNSQAATAPTLRAPEAHMCVTSHGSQLSTVAMSAQAAGCLLVCNTSYPYQESRFQFYLQP